MSVLAPYLIFDVRPDVIGKVLQQTAPDDIFIVVTLRESAPLPGSMAPGGHRLQGLRLDACIRCTVSVEPHTPREILRMRTGS